MLLFAVMGIEEQAMTIGNEHLGNRILIEHSLIQGELSCEDLLVDLVLKQIIFVKGMAYEEAGVPKIS